MSMTSLFAALIAVGAFIRIPVPVSPIPITLQIIFVFLAGAVLGARWGMMSVIVYLLLGAIGLPVFSGGSSGIGVIFGPTGGYLVGFAFAALAIGTLSEKRGTSNILQNVINMLIGLLIIYFFGTVYLMHVANLSIEHAILMGIVPYLPGDALKLMIASIIAARYTQIDIQR